ncbi:hypothetical protein TUM22923_02610 [Polynucleobacter sp. TUM22923]|uniref:type II toxin-antitoxin system RelE/ParE family toxin n=1 Tax=Polynucleobacter sp. TUM22923 TaxID=3022126 RepID=UPI002572A731|nr:type II toxin-antitoxin system RelE/ParE family toxin [Polynucleobacter sp. TUM22923]BDX20940.1 hypothetical protein TUM22923_02610 [Polynucleobacter sp. TUM22923]
MIKSIAAELSLGEERRGDLAGIFTYKFKINCQEFLMAYEFFPDKHHPKEIVLIALVIRSHENFYRDLKK